MIKKCKYHLVTETPVGKILSVYFEVKEDESVDEVSEKIAKEYKFIEYKVKLNPHYKN